jgi:hypothetical protein
VPRGALLLLTLRHSTPRFLVLASDGAGFLASKPYAVDDEMKHEPAKHNEPDGTHDGVSDEFRAEIDRVIG